jgi:6-phosphogluconate dehydrogenase
MIHNGIEYAIMQAIAESYDLLSRVGGLEPGAIGSLFAEWNRAELASFLVEITSHILGRLDDSDGAEAAEGTGEHRQALVNFILDKAEQKGTGRWTSENALEIGVPVSAITAAVEARILSSFKSERTAASELLRGPVPAPDGNVEALVAATRAALYATMIVAYTQGLALIKAASAEYDYQYDLGEVARIWRAGCIIRAELLEEIRRAFADRPDLPNLLQDDEIRDAMAERQAGWRSAISTGVAQGIPMPVLSAALAYYDGYRSARLPAYLIQAQRDYFGAHTYQRLDREGTFHTRWAEALTDE